MLEGGVCTRHLRLDADEPCDRQISCPVACVVEQRCLADAGVAAQDVRSTLATAGGLQQSVDRGPLMGPPTSMFSAYSTRFPAAAGLLRDVT